MLRYLPIVLVILCIPREYNMSLWDFMLGKGRTKNINNLEQEVNNVSDVQSPNNYNQSQSVNLAENPSFDPHTANNPIFNQFTDWFGPAQQNADGTWSHKTNNVTDAAPQDLQTDTLAPAVDSVSDYDQMISNIGARYGMGDEGLDDIMNRISFHETGPGSRNDPTTVQAGGGPGRGLFQFETGQGQGGATAMNRLHRWYKEQGMDVPEWAKFDASQGVDASQLTPEQQKMMFMANVRYHPTASLEGVTGDNLSDFWQNYHYAGDIDKRGAFDESMAAYNINNTPTVDELGFGIAE